LKRAVVLDAAEEELVEAAKFYEKHPEAGMRRRPDYWRNR